MPSPDDDDDFRDSFRDSRGQWDEDSWDVDEDPDQKDQTPDDFTTVRCTHCKKLIFEDAVQCPYCKHWQLEEQQTRKPLWFRLTVIFCIAVMVPGLLALLYMWLWWR